MRKRTLLFPLFFVGLFSAPIGALADDYWQETVSPSGAYARFTSDGFDFFALHIPEGTTAQVQTASGWQAIPLEDEADPLARWSELIEWNEDSGLLLKFEGKVPDKVTVDFTKTTAMAYNPARLLTSTAAVGSLPIVARSSWGADESWRYTNDEMATPLPISDKTSGSDVSAVEEKCNNAQDSFPDEFEVKNLQATENGRKLIWPYQYSNRVRKIVVHHTAETGVKNGRAADEVMRAIYRYHAVSKGWGDIGYHYVIAPDGTVYEGRAGGKAVVGGHVYCNNIGTIGVALMGNFNEYDPSGPQIVALKQLLPKLAKDYELDLTATSWYHGKVTPNLVGHRDLGATACPGNYMYALLPDIRRGLEGSAEIKYAQSVQPDGKPSGSLTVLKLNPGEERDVKLSFANTGNAAWTNSTWLFAQAGSNVEIRPVAGTKRYVAARMHEQQVAPGQTANFTVRLKAGYNGGVSTVSFVPVVKDQRLMNAETLQVVEVVKPDWNAEFSAVKMSPPKPVTGKSTSISAVIKNSGVGQWEKGRVTLSIKTPSSRTPISLALSKNVLPGKLATFTGRLPAFLAPGPVKIELQLLADGKALTPAMTSELTVVSSDNRAELKSFPRKLVMVKAGTPFREAVEYLNTGNTEWRREDLRLEIMHRRERSVIMPVEEVIPPGGMATFPFAVDAKLRVQPYILTLKDGRQPLSRKPLILLGLTELKNATPLPTPKPSASPTASNAPIPVTSAGNIRIRLSFPVDKKEAVITSAGAYRVTDGNGKVLASAKAGEAATVALDDLAVNMEGVSAPVFRFVPETPAGIMEIKNWERYSAWDINRRWNDNVFAGTLELRSVDGLLTVINELPLETYLTGLGETVETQHIEKLKAIALVARSYAAFYMDPDNRKFPGKPYDGSDSPAEFQKYVGANLAKRTPVWQSALAATKGEVVTYNGELIKTPFSSSSGGKTTSAFDRWGWTNTPYLVSVDDPGCKGIPQAGHGVGLSGCGAQYFAEQGKSYKEILKYYFQGIEIGKL